MRNNRKDTSDQRGEGKKHFQRNRDEMLGRDKERERRREGDVAAAAKLFCLRVAF